MTIRSITTTAKFLYNSGILSTETKIQGERKDGDGCGVILLLYFLSVRDISVLR